MTVEVVGATRSTFSRTASSAGLFPMIWSNWRFLSSWPLHRVILKPATASLLSKMVFSRGLSLRFPRPLKRPRVELRNQTAYAVLRSAISYWILRWSPHLLILYINVVLFTPKRAAAPDLPLTTQLLSLSAFNM